VGAGVLYWQNILAKNLLEIFVNLPRTRATRPAPATGTTRKIRIIVKGRIIRITVTIRIIVKGGIIRITVTIRIIVKVGIIPTTGTIGTSGIPGNFP